jgi:hypothetical protein
MPEHSSSTVLGTLNPPLSASQLATLAEVGEDRTANVGDVLYRVGDRRYPFIAIREGMSSGSGTPSLDSLARRSCRPAVSRSA